MIVKGTNLQDYGLDWLEACSLRVYSQNLIESLKSFKILYINYTRYQINFEVMSCIFIMISRSYKIYLIL